MASNNKASAASVKPVASGMKSVTAGIGGVKLVPSAKPTVSPVGRRKNIMN